MKKGITIKLKSGRTIIQYFINILYVLSFKKTKIKMSTVMQNHCITYYVHLFFFYFLFISLNTCVLIMDWAMKFLPITFREKQSNWYGQKGLNWHVSVCIYKDEDSNLKVRQLQCLK